MREFTLKDLDKLMSRDYMTRKQRKEFEKYKRGLVMRELFFRYGKRFMLKLIFLLVVICVALIMFFCELIGIVYGR